MIKQRYEDWVISKMSDLERAMYNELDYPENWMATEMSLYHVSTIKMFVPPQLRNVVLIFTETGRQQKEPSFFVKKLIRKKVDKLFETRSIVRLTMQNLGVKP